MTFAVEKIPTDLLRRERPVDDVFEPDEGLFRRCKPEHTSGEELLATGVKLPNLSVNRSKFGDADSVLIPVYLDWSIATFTVSDVSVILTTGDKSKKEVAFRAAHVPEPTNYPHSEIRGFDEYNVFIESPSRKVQRELRNRIAQVAKVIHHGTVTHETLVATAAERDEVCRRLIAEAEETA